MKKPKKFYNRDFDESFLDQCDERIAAFYQMWKSKCKGNTIPARSDFDPIEMVDFLPGITLVDVDKETLNLTYRLVGTNEVAVRGKDPTGDSVKEHFHATTWEDTWENYNHAINNQGIVFDDMDMPNSNGIIVGDETIFVPLSPDGEHVNMVMLYSIQREPTK
ncbi:PAS domain-containing protein [Kiloniella sp. EL199]|uniref:PAS domain-containing protein n=1 Tax=Kiloniella sp. EL199 TaxID=2107581 RepID=UPI000EA3BB37|nr:PAS domain-containing protein [Kiloniella sp. EL199]